MTTRGTKCHSLDGYDLNEQDYKKMLRRTQRFAASRNGEHEREHVGQVVVIGVGAERLGIPALSAREVVDAPAITALRDLPSWMPGMVQIRGDIMSAVQLASLLSITNAADPQCLVVAKGRGGLLGLLGDALLGFRDVYADDLAEDFGQRGEHVDRLVSAVTKDFVAILDVERLFADPRLVVSKKEEEAHA